MFDGFLKSKINTTYKSRVSTNYHEFPPFSVKIPSVHAIVYQYTLVPGNGYGSITTITMYKTVSTIVININININIKSESGSGTVS